MSFAPAAPAAAQIFGKPTRPQVDAPKGSVRQVLFKNCTSCHGIDDYAYNALDRAGWNALIDSRHKDQKIVISAADRELLLDWVVARFGPSSRPFPRAYVPPEITTYFSDAEAQTLLARACTSCHSIDRVNDARYSADRWRVVSLDMRQRGAKLEDEEL
jgi:cytochrome c2